MLSWSLFTADKSRLFLSFPDRESVSALFTLLLLSDGSEHIVISDMLNREIVLKFFTLFFFSPMFFRLYFDQQSTLMLKDFLQRHMRLL